MEVSTGSNNTDDKINIEDELFSKVKISFLNAFFPIKSYSRETIFMSTEEVYKKFQYIFPSPNYTISDIAKWLYSEGFEIFNVAEGRFEWLMGKFM